MDTKIQEYVESLSLADLDELIRELQNLRHQKEDPRIKFFEQKAEEYLDCLGIDCTLKGYKYLKCAVVAVAENQRLGNALTTSLYPMIANKFKTTPKAVEHMMRWAIEKCVDDNHKKIYAYFSTISYQKGKPTNGQFIVTMAKRLRDAWEEYYK